MEDWLTYRLSDLLLFSPRTYYRLLELHNRELWPAHVVTLAVGVASLFLLRAATPRRTRLVVLLVSAVWAWVAWAFHLERYATINWAARYFAFLFALQAVLMLWSVLRERRGDGPTAVGARSPAGARIALGLSLFALFVQPLIGPLVGRSWTQMETFGAAPDPTAVATLGMIPLAIDRPPLHLVIVPLLWCVIGGATSWAMGSPDAPLLPLLGSIGLVAALRARST